MTETLPLDTYEVVPMQTDSPDELAEFRAQVRAELEEGRQRSKMSDSALQKLRLVKEQDRLQEMLDARFASALRLIVPTPENLVKLVDRCNQSVRIPAAQLAKRGEKLAWWVAAGYRIGFEIDSVTVINFFSELLDEEVRTSDARFISLWSASSAAKLRATRQNAGLIKTDGPIYRPCKSAKKCLRYERRKAASAAGNGDYCSTACAASDKARLKRASQMTAL